jgi:hypothetical protein
MNIHLPFYTNHFQVRMLWGALAIEFLSAEEFQLDEKMEALDP